MNYLVHIAYVVYLISYSVRDILWLRALTIVASVVLLPYYYFLPEPLFVPMVWLSLFTLINIVQIVILILARRPVKMSEEETELYELTFRSLKPRDFLKLLKIAVRKEAQAGESIVVQGEHVGGVLLLTAGHTQVDVDGRRLSAATPGQFVGEMSYLTEDIASAQVTATRATRYLFWPVESLNEFFSNNPDLSSSFLAILGVDLVLKVQEHRSKPEHLRSEP